MTNNINDNELLEISKQNGMISLDDQVRTMLINGETTIYEALRIGIK